MTAIIPDEGLEWLEKRAIDSDSTEVLYEVAVGTGTTTPSSSDSGLDNEIYRSDITNDNCTIERTSNTGLVRVSIGLTGGLEVSDTATITELGVFTDGDSLAYREVRDGIEMYSGETIQIVWDINFA